MQGSPSIGGAAVRSVGGARKTLWGTTAIRPASAGRAACHLAGDALVEGDHDRGAGEDLANDLAALGMGEGVAHVGCRSG